MNKEEIQEILDKQSELYADCLGTVEDRLAERFDELFKHYLGEFEGYYTKQIDTLLRKYLGDMERHGDRKLENMLRILEDNVCSRVYKGLRVQFDRFLKISGKGQGGSYAKKSISANTETD